jgi:lipid-binding SYLF domain-containing protein
MRIGLAAVVVGTIVLLSSNPAPADEPGEKEDDRLQACHEVVKEMATAKEDIPRDLLDKARCVIVIPGVVKAALGVGARLGWGAAVCRTGDNDGPWGAPLMVSLKGGSFGFQIGGQSTDLVLLVMGRKGIEQLLKSKFNLGADVSVAAGPVGRNAAAATDATMHAEILSYSRSRGLFAGISLEGASLAQDKTGNEAVYGGRVEARRVLLEPGWRLPVAGRGLVDTLERLSPRRRS